MVIKSKPPCILIRSTNCLHYEGVGRAEDGYDFDESSGYQFVINWERKVQTSARRTVVTSLLSPGAGPGVSPPPTVLIPGVARRPAPAPAALAVIWSPLHRPPVSQSRSGTPWRQCKGGWGNTSDESFDRASFNVRISNRKNVECP